MKKVIFGLVLLVGGVLFVINYLGGITSDATNKVSSNALNQLIATGNKTEQNQPTANTKQPEDKPTVIEQVTNTVKQATDTALAPLNDNKAPIASIKIYDKKTNKEISIQTQTMLNAQQQVITPQQKEEQKIKDEKFKSFYHKSQKCLSPSDNETRTACGNEYIRAKARFEELYKQGKI
jgi:flagellar biosynthesis GTPase FlhF